MCARQREFEDNAALLGAAEAVRAVVVPAVVV
jgi:hypothetical protein